MDIQFLWQGLKTYDQGLSLQKKALLQIKEGADDLILGMEHPTVLTLGLRSHHDPMISEYQKIFSEVVKIRRGGHLVIHNPGQLVIYPIINLKEKKIGVRRYLAWLLESTKKFLLNYGIETFEKDEPGLFTNQGKIALFGVGVNRGISQHGLCINVSNDLKPFQEISICDVKSESLDKISNYFASQTIEEYFQNWCEVALKYQHLLKDEIF